MTKMSFTALAILTETGTYYAEIDGDNMIATIFCTERGGYLVQMVALV